MFDIICFQTARVDILIKVRIQFLKRFCVDFDYWIIQTALQSNLIFILVDVLVIFSTNNNISYVAILQVSSLLHSVQLGNEEADESVRIKGKWLCVVLHSKEANVVQLENSSFDLYCQ